ncbi:pyridoxamine 5'-phosphate oxidase family protein [Candidatus Kaiserbacteria bacterium]|nr:pyridoxamine 5'-phosphate oxidase family protein [Candidatus Kaiserbacteria bacterium]
MADLRALAKEVLDDAFLMTLATQDAEGPWAASVIFVADKDFNIYWMSKSDARHSRAIAEGGKVAVAITASWQENKERAIQIEGTAQRIDSISPTIMSALSAKRGKKPEPDTAAFILERGLIWYKLTPTRIELIYNELFDYDRQRVL